MKKLHILLLALSAAVCGCDPSDFGTDSPGSGNRETIVPVEHEMIVLGEKLEDPYSVDNITKAVQSLYPTKASSIQITTTDLYIRFLPEDGADIERAEAMGLELIDHPVDYRIVREGDYYHDPKIPEGSPTWQYAIVPAGFSFPADFEYELLDKCFISEHDVITRSSVTDIDWSAVERESFRLTGNEDMLNPERTKSSTAPSGRITIIDDLYSKDPIGVKGVKVSANVFVKFASGYTDENGNYTLDRSFASDPRYRLVFKNEKGFALGVNLILIQGSISTLGTGSPEGIDCQIDKDSNRALFCRSVVNNAGYDYWDSCGNGKESIALPPSNLRIWLFQGLDCSSTPMLQQGAIVDGSILEEYLGEYCSLVKIFLPDITLGVKGHDDYASIYGTAFHEMAHASHYMQVGNGYWNELIDFVLRSAITGGGNPYGTGKERNCGYCAVSEMWSYYLETKIWRDRYPEDARSFGTSFWFKPQVFYYMDERGINRYKIFKALTDDVHDLETLQAKLLALYPECKTTINQAFDRYK